jgi:hypothetical protein
MPSSATWSPERRQRQAKIIHQWQPWNKSTGPRSTEGKVRSAKNGARGRIRPLLRLLSAVLRAQDEALLGRRAKA